MFETVRKLFYIYLGLNGSQKCEKLQWFNIRLLIGMFFMYQFGISSFLFFCFEANTFGELANSFYICATMIANIIIMTVTIAKSENLFQMFENFESAIEKRENQIDIYSRNSNSI